MQMIGIPKSKINGDGLETLNKQQKLQVGKQFEQAVIKRTLSNETIRKTLNLLSKV